MIAVSTRSCLPGSCLDVRKVTYLIVLQEKKIMVSSATTLKVMQSTGQSTWHHSETSSKMLWDKKVNQIHILHLLLPLTKLYKYKTSSLFITAFNFSILLNPQFFLLYPTRGTWKSYNQLSWINQKYTR